MWYCPHVELTDKPVNHWFSAEMLVAYHFCLQDYRVSVPLSPCEYDLVVDTGIAIKRIQIKKAAFRKQRVRKHGLGDRDHWAVDLTKRRRILGGSGKLYHKRIAAKEFDYLAVVCDGTAVYLIPIEKLHAEEKGLLLRMIQIKDSVVEGRLDSMRAGERWKPYRNNFSLEESCVSVVSK